MYWYSQMRRQKLDRQRRIRLQQKAQKAGLLEVLPVIVQQTHSWNGRFRAVNTLAHS